MSVPVRFVQPELERIFLAMFFCRPVHRGPGRVETSAAGSILEFSGAANGKFFVVVSEDLARRITADFLALDAAEVSRDRIQGMVNEFANVACGAIMSAWMPAGDFHFSIPRGLHPDGRPTKFEHCFSVLEEGIEFGIEIALH